MRLIRFTSYMKIIAGITPADSGTLEIGGNNYVRLTPVHAHQLGIYLVLRIPAWWNDFIAGMVLLAVLVFDGRLRCALERNLRRQKYARFMMPPPSVKPASSGKKREAA